MYIARTSYEPEPNPNSGRHSFIYSVYPHKGSMQSSKSKGIEHRYTKVRHPWTNGFVERFQRAILEEFYQPALLKRTYHTIKELQYDLDQFLYFYNFQRTHQGYRTKGSRPCDLLYNVGDFLPVSP